MVTSRLDIDPIGVLKNATVDLNRGDGVGKTPLHYAAYMNHVESIRVLVELGADVNKGDDRGRTPLHCAASKNNVESLHVLKGRKIEEHLCIVLL